MGSDSRFYCCALKCQDTVSWLIFYIFSQCLRTGPDQTLEFVTFHHRRRECLAVLLYFYRIWSWSWRRFRTFMMSNRIQRRQKITGGKFVGFRWKCVFGRVFLPNWFLNKVDRQWNRVDHEGWAWFWCDVQFRSLHFGLQGCFWYSKSRKVVIFCFYLWYFCFKFWRWSFWFFEWENRLLLIYFPWPHRNRSTLKRHWCSTWGFR